MKITEVHLYQKALPVKGGSFKLALSEVSSLTTTVVGLETDTGLTGYGETCPLGPTYAPQHALGARAALTEIAPHLLGCNPLLLETVRRTMDAALNGHNYAKAAVDIALWDLAGKHYGARVCDLLGGAVRERVPSYYSVGVMQPDEAARVVQDKVKEGYGRIQVKVGQGVEADIATIHRVSEVLRPGVRLAVDANRGWTTRDALTVSQRCRDLSFVIEQPCNTLEEIRAIRSRLSHPVYLDESAEDVNTVVRIIGSGLCDGFGFKVTRLGGLSTMRTVRDLCRAASLPHTCDDAWGGDLIAAACVHLGATVEPRLSEGVWLAEPYIEGHYSSENAVRIESGTIALPDGPGLGVAPDEGVFGEAVASWG